MAHRVAASNVFGESPRDLGVDYFVDPDSLQQLTEQGFTPLGIINSRRPGKRQVLEALLTDKNRYAAVPAELQRESVVCVEGLVCLFGRHEQDPPLAVSP